MDPVAEHAIARGLLNISAALKKIADEGIKVQMIPEQRIAEDKVCSRCGSTGIYVWANDVGHPCPHCFQGQRLIRELSGKDGVVFTCTTCQHTRMEIAPVPADSPVCCFCR